MDLKIEPRTGIPNMEAAEVTLADIRNISLRDAVPAKEWATRVTLAAAYRLTHIYGMTDMIANHISARVPEEPGHFLINPYGLLYDEITASTLLKVDLDGNVVSGSPLGYKVNRPGFVIHSAIHAARHDVDCIVHTHTSAGMAISALKCGLLPITQTSTRWSTIAYHDYQGISLDEGERESLIRDFGGAEVMILRNHGLLAAGPSIPEAFNSMYRLELSCKAQIAAMSCNTELAQIPEDVLKLTYSQWSPGVTRRYGLLEWPALLRLLDRTDPSYKN
jgi:ribulose-5-phosphate 4-epimerase/fuculose-1-phosphate aldolase